MGVGNQELQGKIILVTGASSGFGRFFVLSLARLGATVIAAARRRKALDELAAEVEEEGGKCQPVVMDVTDRKSVKNALDQANARYGCINVLINNAGTAVTKPFLQLTEADWDNTLDTNLKGAFNVAQEVAIRLVEQKAAGSIVNITSILGMRLTGYVAPYCASKAGLIHLTKAMALEMARHNIRVNALAPGYVLTSINKEFFATEPGLAMVDRIPQKRLGTMDSLLAPLLLLVSDKADYMTGSVLEVDGGHLLSTL